MKANINIWETAAAVAIIVFAGVMAYVGSSYPIGTAQAMGPGYFPILLGTVTMLLGGLTLLTVLRSQVPPPDVPWASFFFVFAGLLAWALLVERLGLIPATFSLVVLASLAHSPVRPLAVVLTAAIVSVASVVLFIHGFGLPLRAFRW